MYWNWKNEENKTSPAKHLTKYDVKNLKLELVWHRYHKTSIFIIFHFSGVLPIYNIHSGGPICNFLAVLKAGYVLPSVAICSCSRQIALKVLICYQSTAPLVLFRHLLTHINFPYQLFKKKEIDKVNLLQIFFQSRY